MTPTHARGQGRRKYRYYVAAELVRGDTGPQAGAIRRVPAEAVESLVAERLGRLFAGGAPAPWSTVSPYLVRAAILPDAIHLTVRLHDAALGGHDQASWMRSAEGRLSPGDALRPTSGDEHLVRLTAPVRLQVRGGRTWMMRPDGSPLVPQGRPDATLVKALRRAHHLLEKSGASLAPRAATPTQVRSPEDSFERKLLRLAFLAPDIQLAILEGRQPVGLTLARLGATTLPQSWIDQRQLLGFPETDHGASAAERFG